MKPFVLAMFILFGMAANVNAAPSLVCDPPAAGSGVQYYVISGMPAGIDGSHVLPESTGTFGFRVDMATTAPGTYTVAAKACK